MIIHSNWGDSPLLKICAQQNLKNLAITFTKQNTWFKCKTIKKHHILIEVQYYLKNNSGYTWSLSLCIEKNQHTN